MWKGIKSELEMSKKCSCLALEPKCLWKCPDFLLQVWKETLTIWAVRRNKKSSCTLTSSSWCFLLTDWTPIPPPAGASGHLTPITASSKTHSLNLEKQHRLHQFFNLWTIPDGWSAGLKLWRLEESKCWTQIGLSNKLLLCIKVKAAKMNAINCHI